MADKKKTRKPHPVCAEHWNRLRQEAVKGVPFWAKPLVNRKLREQGFVLSKTECAFCKTKTDVEEVKP